MIKKILMVLGSIVVVAIGILFVYLKVILPTSEDPPVLNVELSPENIERGRYLANHVMVCMDCHSERNWDLYSGPPVPGTLGRGGEVFDQSMGFPEKFIADNITPARLQKWTDGEIFRAIITGISKDGSALFNIMLYHHYGTLDENDIKAVIAYIRSIDPIEHQVAESKPDFPMSLLINTLPSKASFNSIPPKSDKVRYGEYMVTAGGCYDCHTKQEKGKFIGEDFAGGMEFKFPDGAVVRSSNITPHSTGIGSWSEEQFVRRFTFYSDSVYTPKKVGPGEFQTMMPWVMYAGMTEVDLKAIYAYLKTLEPVDNPVTRFTPAK